MRVFRFSGLVLGIMVVLTAGLVLAGAGCGGRGNPGDRGDSGDRGDRGDRGNPGDAGGRAIRVQFGWTFDAHHIGFLVARQMGFYEAQGLTVDLRPGDARTNAITAVVSGDADIGQASGPEQLLLAAAQGHPVQAFAVFHRVSPHALISTTRNPIRRIEDLRGRRVAVAYGDTAEIMLRAALAGSPGLEAQVMMTPFQFDLAPLLAGEVDAVTGFKSDQPVTLRAHGIEPVVLDYTQPDLASYGYLLFARRDRSASDPAIYQAFTRASRRGWEYAFAHPDQAIDVLIASGTAGMSHDVERAKLDLVRNLMVDPSGKLATWSADPAVIAAVGERLIQQGLLRTAPRYHDIFPIE